MALTSSAKIANTPYSIAVAEAAAAETAEGTQGTANLAEAIALTEGYNETGDWIYSATAESLGGEVAVLGLDVDDEPGLIYSGPVGGAISVVVDGVAVLEGTIAPEATDSVVLAIMLNNTVVGYADEGYTSELDTETAVTFNAATYIGNLQEGDVVRVALIGGGEEASDWDVTPGNVKIV
jgi:hypothetical protein